MRIKSRYRYLQFSLRTVFLVLTVSAVWFSFVIRRTTEQREAVKEIEALGGVVAYDWQLEPNSKEPPGPPWLRRVIGDDLFQDVQRVYILPTSQPPHPYHIPTDSDMLKAIPHLKRLRRLKQVWYWKHVSEQTHRELKSALPNSEVVPIGPSF
jgi:hypothetical protein